MCCTQSLSIDARNSFVACSRATLVEVQKKFSVPAAYKRVSNRGYPNRSVFFDSKRRYGDTRGLSVEHDVSVAIAGQENDSRAEQRLDQV
jgi:hypothetical protein